MPKLIKPDCLKFCGNFSIYKAVAQTSQRGKPVVPIRKVFKYFFGIFQPTVVGKRVI